MSDNAELGITVQQLADGLGVSLNCVRYRMNRLRIRPNRSEKGSGNGFVFTQSQADKIRGFRRCCWACNQVACICTQPPSSQATRQMPEYNTWASIKQRCLNPNNGDYSHYGGRGITMCDQWRNSFATFYKDVGPRPSSKHSIERIDNNGNYEPSNVCWATQAEQVKNQQRSVRITIDGVTRCLKDWADLSPVSYSTVYQRLRSGWEPRAAIFTERLSQQQYGAAKLTEDDVRAIRAAEGLSNTEIGLQFGICRATVIDIRERRMWKHVA